jgi:surfactin family lipopeptide synthetase C
VKADDIEDIYALSPMQAGMLFHSLLGNSADPYLRQWSCHIEGRIDGSIFDQAWRIMAERHTMLRTSFHWEGLEKPVQVVHRNVPTFCEFLDWSEIAPREREEKITDALAERRRAELQFSRPPLMRLTLIRTEEESYLFIWSYHHLIMDAWSRSLLFKEILIVYQALRSRLDSTLARSRPYKDYIVWLKHQDYAQAEAFWKKYFEDCDAPLLDAAANKDGLNSDTHDTQRVHISGERSEELRDLARGHGITLGTLFQGVWALILSYYYNCQDLVFGMVISGRPAGMEGSESIVGPFINTAPVRVRVTGGTPAVLWLKDLQTRRAELSQHEHCALVDVQQWSGFRRGKPLFDTLLNINNFPGDDLPLRGLSVQDVNLEEGHPYPLIFQVTLGKEILLSIPYERRHFSAHVICGMLDTAQSLLTAISQDPDVEVRELLNGLKEKEQQARKIRVEKYKQLRSRKTWNI